MHRFIDFDKWFFVKINRDAANPFFDQLMPFLRLPTIWVPFYLFLLLFVVINFKKKVFPFVLIAATTASITDIISSRFIKPGIGRLRPCNDAEMLPQLRLLVNYCGQNGSFTSSHAANHFGLAMFLFIVLKPVWGRYCWLFFAWAALICFAQVYVGVHFPFDVIGGGIFGSMVGYITGKIFQSQWGPLTNT